MGLMIKHVSKERPRTLIDWTLMKHSILIESFDCTCGGGVWQHREHQAGLRWRGTQAAHNRGLLTPLLEILSANGCNELPLWRGSPGPWRDARPFLVSTKSLSRLPNRHPGCALRARR